MARHPMFVDCSRAERELGFRPGPVENALERAVRWYIKQEYAPAILGSHGQRRQAAWGAKS